MKRVQRSVFFASVFLDLREDWLWWLLYVLREVGERLIEVVLFNLDMVDVRSVDAGLYRCCNSVAVGSLGGDLGMMKEKMCLSPRDGKWE